MPHLLTWTFYEDYFPYPVDLLRQALGNVPYYLDAEDGRPAIEQFNERYPGTWDALPGFTLIDGLSLKYPGDPLMNPIASTELHGELILVYPYGWVCVRRADRTIEVARMP